MVFLRLQQHVTEVFSHRYYLVETENQDTCSIMVFLKEIVNEGCFCCFKSFSLQIADDSFAVTG